MLQADAPRSSYYVEVDERLKFKPKFQRILDISRARSNDARCYLEDFWIWVQQLAIDYQDDLGLLPWCGIESVVRVCGGDEAFWMAVKEVGWIDFTAEGIVIPGFAERFSRAARKRRKDANRKFDQRNSTETPKTVRATSSEPPVPKDFSNSVFYGLTREQLRNWSQMLVWFDDAVRRPKPVIADTEPNLSFVLAASRYVASRDAKNPAAYFCHIVTGRRTDILQEEPSIIEQAWVFVRSLGDHRAGRADRALKHATSQLEKRFSIKQA